ncbi:hypothetical protein BHM03_00022894 [Ensete ventricosum]|nr:hypothetical protein BHM03_00022894 [Ensete ventricosum]
MASLYPGHVGAVQVGAYFLEQYYRILQQQPELVHQFYTDVSSMARFDGTATETATGMVSRDLVPSVEENDTVEKYSIPEALQQLPESDERVDESPVEDAASYPSALDTARDPPLATPEEPVEEPTRQTYASIVALESSLQPTSQRPQPALVSERSISEAAEEAPLVEDEAVRPSTGWYVLVHQLTGTWIARYRAVHTDPPTDQYVDCSLSGGMYRSTS